MDVKMLGHPIFKKAHIHTVAFIYQENILPNKLQKDRIKLKNHVIQASGKAEKVKCLGGKHGSWRQRRDPTRLSPGLLPHVLCGMRALPQK